VFLWGGGGGGEALHGFSESLIHRRRPSRPLGISEPLMLKLIHEYDTEESTAPFFGFKPCAGFECLIENTASH